MDAEVLLPALISSLVGLSAGLLVFSAAGRLASRRASAAERSDLPLSLKLLPWLEAVPVPKFLARRWNTGDLNSKLTQAGSLWSPKAFLAFRYLLLLGSIAAAVTMLAHWGSGLLPVVLATLALFSGVLLPQVVMDLQIERRRMSLERSLPDLLDRLNLGLEAGLGFELALRRTSASFRGLLGEEIRRAVRMLDRGHPKSEAIGALAQRSPSRDLGAFAASVRQAERLGTSLSKTLKVQSKLLRAHRQRRAQEASRRLPILIVFPLVFFFLPALLIVYLAPPLLHLFLGR